MRDATAAPPWLIALKAITLTHYLGLPHQISHQSWIRRINILPWSITLMRPIEACTNPKLRPHLFRRRPPPRQLRRRA